MVTPEEGNDKPTGSATVEQLYSKAEMQAAIAAAMMGAVAALPYSPPDPDHDECDLSARYNFGFDKGVEFARDALISLIPTDTTAAMEPHDPAICAAAIRAMKKGKKR